MADAPVPDAGLPWPEAYDALLPVIRKVGRDADARKEVALIRESLPNFSIDRYHKRQTFRNEADSKRFSDAVHAAGLT